jgi:hypothetical protein
VSLYNFWFQDLAVLCFDSVFTYIVGTICRRHVKWKEGVSVKVSLWIRVGCKLWFCPVGRAHLVMKRGWRELCGATHFVCIYLHSWSCWLLWCLPTKFGDGECGCLLGQSMKMGADWVWSLHLLLFPYIITQYLPIGKYNIAPFNTYSHFEIVYWSASLFSLAITLKLVTVVYAKTLELFQHMM